LDILLVAQVPAHIGELPVDDPVNKYENIAGGAVIPMLVKRW